MINLEFAQEVGYGQYFYRSFLRQFYKRIMLQDCQIRLPNGKTINLPRNSRFASEIFVTNCNVDWGSEQILIENLEPDKDFLDVGANIGYYSLLAANCVRRVYAFEPDERNLAILKNNIINYNNIEIIEQPVFSQIREVQFSTVGCSEVSHIVSNQSGNSSNLHEIKLTTTLNDFADNNPKMSVTGIKIDVEGADFDVLLGADKLIQRDNPLILAEFFSIKDELVELVNDLNYEIFAFTKSLYLSNKTRNNFNFTRITKDNKDTFRYKMIFIVPPRLINKFMLYQKTN